MDELLSFLSHERLIVRHEAVKLVAGLTGDEANFAHFKGNDQKPIRDLMELIKEEALTSHDALSSLINLSQDVSFIETLSDATFLKELVLMMLIPTNVNADLCCMLLNNLSKHDCVMEKILPQDLQQNAQGTAMLDNLLEIFVKGDTNVFNKEANFNFLAGVFANISASAQGCMHFLNKSTVDGTSRLSKLVVFTEHSNLFRRGGVISTLKNVCYGVSLEKKGLEVLLDPELNLFVYVLLPLMGPEEYEMDEIEGMPDELQFLSNDKKREVDPQLRLMLLEILVALGSERSVREFMRKIKVYEIIKKLHLQESNTKVSEMVEILVNLLMRDESEE